MTRRASANIIALSPGLTDVGPTLVRLLGFAFDGLEDFVIRSAPVTHVSHLTQDTFLFHATADESVPIDETTELVRKL